MSLPPSPRMETDMKIVTESGSHTPAVEKLVAEAFGPDRFAKTVYRLRDGVEHDASLALVALDKGEVVALAVDSAGLGHGLGIERAHPGAGLPLRRWRA